MEEQFPLDDPNEEKRLRRSHTLTWWAAGLAMGILLLIANLLDQSGVWPEMLVLTEQLAYSTQGLVVFGIFTLGSAALAEWILRTDPDIRTWRVALYATGSGFLAESIFQFVKIAGAMARPGWSEILFKGLILLIAASFCGVVAWIWCSVRKKERWWTGVVALLTWLFVVMTLLRTLHILVDQ